MVGRNAVEHPLIYSPIDQPDGFSHPMGRVRRTVPHRSKMQKMTPITMMSQARWRRAQGARNNSAIPCRAVPTATCSSTRSPWARRNKALATQRISTSQDPLRAFSKRASSLRRQHLTPGFPPRKPHQSSGQRSRDVVMEPCESRSISRPPGSWARPRGQG